MYFQFDGSGGPPVAVEEPKHAGSPGFLWLDFVRGDVATWTQPLAELGHNLYHAHVSDSLNSEHASFFDATEEYEMIILQGLCADSGTESFETRPTCFFLFRDVLVTIRPNNSVSIPKVAARLTEGKGRVPRSPGSLFYAIANAIVDRFVALRSPLVDQFSTWQRRLLDPEDSFDEWRMLVLKGTDLRRLEVMCEDQRQAIESWREETRHQIETSLGVRLNDLIEHINRVENTVRQVQAETEATVQIHFSALAHRTNEIMRVLTVLAGVFLPLSFLAGLFGMNFEYMPELKWKYSYFVTLGVMLSTAIGLLLFFRKRRWI